MRRASILTLNISITQALVGSGGFRFCQDPCEELIRNILDLLGIFVSKGLSSCYIKIGLTHSLCSVSIPHPSPWQVNGPNPNVLHEPIASISQMLWVLAAKAPICPGRELLSNRSHLTHLGHIPSPQGILYTIVTDLELKKKKKKGSLHTLTWHQFCSTVPHSRDETVASLPLRSHPCSFFVFVHLLAPESSIHHMTESQSLTFSL